MKQIHSNLYRLLVPTPLAEALCIVPSGQVEGFSQLYLHDYLRTVHHPIHPQYTSELEVRNYSDDQLLRNIQLIISLHSIPCYLILNFFILVFFIQLLDAVVYAVMNGSELNYIEHQSLLSRLIAAHVAYHYHQKEIACLGQLISLQPGILVNLKHMDGKSRFILNKNIILANICSHFIAAQGYNRKYIDIHLHAVQFALEELELPLDIKTRHNFPERLSRLQLCQNVISSVLEASATIPLARNIRSLHACMCIMTCIVHAFISM